MIKLDNNIKPDKKLAAVCGLFCPSCSLFIGNVDDPARLETMAKKWGKSIDDLTCHGCRSDKRTFYCENLCKMYKCAGEKGIDFCIECNEYPCKDLKDFQSQAPHRIELWDSLKQIKESGFEKWFVDMANHYSCSECNVINSAYDIKCRKCGKTPGNNYVNLHKKEIMSYLEKSRDK